MHTNMPRFQLAHLGSKYGKGRQSRISIESLAIWLWKLLPLTLVPLAVCAALVALELQ